MTQEIHFTNKEFDFSKITISQPVAVQGGAYFTKIKYDNTPLYIQTLKCITKQGLNETSKKAYIDLMYTNDDEEIVEWFESLESKLIDLLFSKSELWFQNEMDLSDIENNFNSITRAFKGGKYHLVRINIPKNKAIGSQYNCSMYDENETIVPIQELKESQSIIPILEIQGIKFTARSFQLDIIGKQIMLLENKPIFNSCLIKKNTSDTPSTLAESIVIDNNKQALEEIKEVVMDDVSNINKTPEIIANPDVMDKNSYNDNDAIVNELLDNNEIDEIDDNNTNDDDKDVVVEDDDSIELENDKHNDVELTTNDPLKNKMPKDSDYLEEISDNITINDGTNIKLKLKKPNEVYYEIYKITREKAKQHKQAAVAHYLEAKNIKNSYLLENIDSDDSSDEEITSDSDKINSDLDGLIQELY